MTLKHQLLDLLIGRHDYKTGWEWRVAAGFLTVLGAVTMILMLRMKHVPHFLALVAVAYATFLFAFIAVTGRVPRWLQRRPNQ